MDWTNDMVIEFLQVFGTEPIIWNPKHPEHKKKHLLAEAWRRINKTLNWQCTVEDLKKKRDNLMAYYRIHLNKIRKLRVSGMADDDYRTNWFAYDTMNSFLGNIYDSSISCSPEHVSTERIQTVPESTDSANGSEYHSDSEYQLKRKRKMQEVLVEVDRLNSRSVKGINECEMYVQLLVHKLMKLDEDDRLILMNKIDNLVFETTMEVNARKKSDSRAAALHKKSSYVSYDNNTASLRTETTCFFNNKIGPLQTYQPDSSITSRIDQSSSVIDIDTDVEIKHEI